MIASPPDHFDVFLATAKSTLVLCPLNVTTEHGEPAVDTAVMKSFAIPSATSHASMGVSVAPLTDAIAAISSTAISVR